MIIPIKPYLERLREFERQCLGCTVDDESEYCEDCKGEKNENLIEASRDPEFQRF